MKLSGILFVIIIVMGGIGYWYYNDTQNRIEILNQNNATLTADKAALQQAVVDQQEVTDRIRQEYEANIAELQANYALMQETNRQLEQAYADIRRQNNRLAERLSDIDLGLIASQRPDSIERAVNRGTVNAGRCFEILSGSPLTETELNATDGESFNKECPWLWPGTTTVGVPEQPSGSATPAGD
jgi:multidrug efflux pump subunit AcrA (membrane-fusion protein)